MKLENIKDKKIIILGGGPTGLGAAWRLNELGFKNWKLFEATGILGGHSASHYDKKEFAWDEGGHIFFSSIPYFNDFFEKVFKGRYFIKKRVQPILFQDRLVPYPFQNHIRYLPAEILRECLDGVIEVSLARAKDKARNFLEFNNAVMGKGITRHFMEPYNRKVWAWPLEEMDISWIAERVSVIDLRRTVNHLVYKEDDKLWGPNAYFRHPKKGGTGAFWNQFRSFFPGRIIFNKEARKVNFKNKIVSFSDNSKEHYDYLISTLPINELIKYSDSPSRLKKLVAGLKYNSGILVGLGVKGNLPKMLRGRIGIYFPDPRWSFHRATVLKNFSPHTVPLGTWSITFEASYSPKRKLTISEVLKDAKTFLKEFKLIKNEKQIISVWKKDVPYFYPIPTLGFKKILGELQNFLLKKDVFSRGRFGNWKYEIGNMDHSFMLGVEAVNHINTGKEDLFEIYED